MLNVSHACFALSPQELEWLQGESRGFATVLRNQISAASGSVQKALLVRKRREINNLGHFLGHALALHLVGTVLISSTLVKLLTCVSVYFLCDSVMVVTAVLKALSASPLTRSASFGAKNNCEDYCSSRNRRKRSIRGSVAWKMVWGRRGRENILLQRRKILVSRGRNLSDGDVETREHPWLHCC